MNQSTEAEIKAGCEEYLQTLQNMGELLYLRLNSGMTIIEGDKRRIVRGCQKGTSDLYALRRGVSWFFECKRAGKKPTPTQREFGDRVIKCDGLYIVVNHWEDIKRLFENWDAIFDKVAIRIEAE